MMMTANQHSPYDLLAAVVPPGVYFGAASQILNIARSLFRSRVFGASGLRAALALANRLSRVGIRSWRVRQRLKDR